MLEAKIVLSKLVQHYDFEQVEPHLEFYAYQVTSVPHNGCKLRFRKRQ